MPRGRLGCAWALFGAGIVLTVSGKLPVAALCSSYAQPGLLDIRKNQANGNNCISLNIKARIGQWEQHSRKPF